MSYTQKYLEMMAVIDGEIRQKCLEIMTRHIGMANAINIEDLAAELLGTDGEKEIRIARKVIEELRIYYQLPIMSASGYKGRWLAETPKEIDAVIHEFEHRIQAMKTTISGLIAARDRMEAEQNPPSTDSGQMEFIFRTGDTPDERPAYPYGTF